MPNITLADKQKAGYNMAMVRFAFIVCMAGTFAAATEVKKPAGPDEKTKIKIVEYMFKTPLDQASPAVVGPFLELDAETLPKGLRAKARAKQLDVRTLFKLHDTKKKGSVIPVLEGCTASSFVKPMKEIPAYQMAGYQEITEDEEKGVMERTLCKEVDLGCHFSLIVFTDPDPKIPRRLFMHGNDPMMTMVAATRAKSKASIGGNGYFGIGGVSCMH